MGALSKKPWARANLPQVHPNKGISRKTLNDTDLARFMGKVSPEPNTGCWLWLGTAADKDGYGVFWLLGRGERAHRAALMVNGRSVPRGALVLHSCDVPACVNPAHLRVGTQKENIADAIKRKRRDRVRPPLLRGERNNHAVLTEADVREIRGLYAGRCGSAGRPRNNQIPTYRETAAKYGVGRAAIKAVVLRRAWDWLQ